jgi:hypothetical protein
MYSRLAHSSERKNNEGEYRWRIELNLNSLLKITEGEKFIVGV